MDYRTLQYFNDGIACLLFFSLALRNGSPVHIEQKIPKKKGLRSRFSFRSRESKQKVGATVATCSQEFMKVQSGYTIPMLLHFLGHYLQNSWILHCCSTVYLLEEKWLVPATCHFSLLIKGVFITRQPSCCLCIVCFV